MQCVVEKCGRKAHARGMCTMHYQRAKRGIDVSNPDRLIADTNSLLSFLDGAQGGSACVEWPFGKDGYGYGCISYLGRKTRAHRVQWKRRNGGTIPQGMVIRHTCDNPSCVNPDHLTIGTQADNILDQAVHGRKARGEAKGGAKLTDDAVREARQLRERGWTVKSLAERFGVHEGTMAQACRRETWRHVE